MAIGIISGVIIRKLKMEKEQEAYVYKMKYCKADSENLSRKERLKFALINVKKVVRKV